ncbi:MAG TPA: large conductance mechanosensitive channel protein MscL [Dongiaceae bacterium]|nr:large conductance mechanosensitive channel protein MscL [Dongiaceae bacterium]
MARRRRNRTARRRTPRCAHRAKEGTTFKGFGTFIARGNVIDLAVAVIVGSAFTAVVNALVKDILTPLVAAIIGQPDFSRLGFTLGRTHFPVGDFVNALITFLLDALVIYYAVVVPLRTISARFRPEEPVLALKTCPECLSEIAQDARRCKYCTAVLARGFGAPA